MKTQINKITRACNIWFNLNVKENNPLYKYTLNRVTNTFSITFQFPLSNQPLLGCHFYHQNDKISVCKFSFRELTCIGVLLVFCAWLATAAL